MSSPISTWPGRLAASIALVLIATAGCESGLRRIDRRVDKLLAEHSADLGPDALAPTIALI